MELLDHRYLAKLVRQAQQGSSNAFAELYAATYQAQYAYALRILHDEHLAQDALQEAYVRVLKTIGRLQNPQVFVAWLNRITFRICLDLRRRSEREVSLPEDGSFERMGDAGHTPEDEVVDIDSKGYLMRQVMDLGPQESQAIIMRYYQELSIDEVARALSVSRSTAKRLLKSGVGRLRKAML